MINELINENFLPLGSDNHIIKTYLSMAILMREIGRPQRICMTNVQRDMNDICLLSMLDCKVFRD